MRDRKDDPGYEEALSDMEDMPLDDDEMLPEPQPDDLDGDTEARIAELERRLAALESGERGPAV